MTQKNYYNTKLGLKHPASVDEIPLGLPSWFMAHCTMKLGRTSEDEDYGKVIMVVGLRHQDRQREIENEKKLDEARSKTHQGKGKTSSNPESSNHKAIERSLMIQEKRRYYFPTGLSLKTRTTQSGRTISRKTH
jgi:hypothetical protein